MELEIPGVTPPLTVDLPQLGLQMQAPYLRIVGQLVTVGSQAFNDRIEDRFGHHRSAERPLGLDRRGLFTCLLYTSDAADE